MRAESRDCCSQSGPTIAFSRRSKVPREFRADVNSYRHLGALSALSRNIGGLPLPASTDPAEAGARAKILGPLSLLKPDFTLKPLFNNSLRSELSFERFAHQIHATATLDNWWKVWQALSAIRTRRICAGRLPRTSKSLEHAQDSLDLRQSRQQPMQRSRLNRHLPRRVSIWVGISLPTPRRAGRAAVGVWAGRTTIELP